MVRPIQLTQQHVMVGPQDRRNILWQLWRGFQLRNRTSVGLHVLQYIYQSWKQIRKLFPYPMEELKLFMISKCFRYKLANRL